MLGRIHSPTRLQVVGCNTTWYVHRVTMGPKRVAFLIIQTGRTKVAFGLLEIGGIIRRY